MEDAPRPYRPLPVTWFNAVGKGLERIGLRYPKFEAEGLLEAATRQTGLSDFGDACFREGFEMLVESTEHEAELSQFGRIAARSAILGLLTNRLQLVAYGNQHPEIAQERIQRPILIAGLPRTGTTALYGLLAQDKAYRTPMTWEVDFPVPPPKKGEWETDPRIERCQEKIDRFQKLVPGFNAIHPQGARLPEECQQIISYNFTSIGFPVFLDIPSYENWLLHHEFTGAFRWHRFFLRYLQSYYHRERWLIKSPNHIQYLPTLFETYPDVAIIQTHRDPLAVIGSLSSLTYTMRSVFRNHTDPHHVGRNQSEFWGFMLDRCMEDRKRLRETHAKIFDVRFQEILNDPIGLVKRIYAFFDLELTNDTLTRMQHFLEENKRDKHGKHTYTLGMFGLRAAEEAPRFSEYYETFGVERENV